MPFVKPVNMDFAIDTLDVFRNFNPCGLETPAPIKVLLLIEIFDEFMNNPAIGVLVTVFRIVHPAAPCSSWNALDNAAPAKGRIHLEFLMTISFATPPRYESCHVCQQSVCGSIPEAY
jgi:hypothetical protein